MPERTRCGLCFRWRLPETRNARWAWLSDTHIAADASAGRNGYRPARQLERIVSEVGAWAPSGVLVNGDLAWAEGAAGDYARLASLLQPLAKRAPLVLVPGNHDRRTTMLSLLGAVRWPGPARVTAVVEQPPLRLIALDSLAGRGQVGGRIGRAQLGWLESELSAAPHATAVLFVHHPGESSSEGCQDFGELEDVARLRGGVRAIVTGHDHRFSVRRSGRLWLVGLPACGFPFDTVTECGWVEACLGRAGATLVPRERAPAPARRLAWSRVPRPSLDSASR